MFESASKAEFAQAQRTIMDLRAEIQGLQRELGAARAAQARLEGELRETQRRMTEAQRMVDTQREELARVREERDQLAQAGREVQGQLVELGRLRQQAVEAERGQACLQALETAVEKQARELADLKTSAQKATARVKPQPSTTDLVVLGTGSSLNRPISTASSMASSRTVIVQAGDTLWGLARKHRVRLAELIAVNNLTADRILAGQKLLLPDALPE